MRSRTRAHSQYMIDNHDGRENTIEEADGTNWKMLRKPIFIFKKQTATDTAADNKSGKHLTYQLKHYERNDQKPSGISD